MAKSSSTAARGAAACPSLPLCEGGCSEHGEGAFVTPLALRALGWEGVRPLVATRHTRSISVFLLKCLKHTPLCVTKWPQLSQLNKGMTPIGSEHWAPGNHFWNGAATANYEKKLQEGNKQLLLHRAEASEGQKWFNFTVCNRDISVCRKYSSPSWKQHYPDSSNSSLKNSIFTNYSKNWGPCSSTYMTIFTSPSVTPGGTPQENHKLSYML